MTTQESMEIQQYQKVSGAIDFFSQILHLEQLTDYGHPFITALLDLHSSSLFMRDSERNAYILKRSIQDDAIVDQFEECDRFKQVATKIGHVMITGFNRVFSEEFLSQYDMKLFFPLIVQDELIGFIISRECNPITENIDRSYVESIKNLANMAFFIGINSEKRRVVEGVLDRKLYNMMLLHQVNRLLFSELKLEALYQLCVDSVRELTSSSVTSFAIMDSHKKAIVVKAFNDIVTFKNFYGEVKVYSGIKPERILYHLETDADELLRYFEDISIFRKMDASYVVLLIGDGIEGFLTIGSPVSGIPFTKDILDLIESLMYSVRIALNNALYLEELHIQKKLIDESYQAMTQLNVTLKTLNSCESLSELSELILKTLEYQSGLTKGFIALWDSEFKAYKVVATNGFELDCAVLDLAEEANSHLESGIFYHFDSSILNRWLPRLPIQAQVTLIAPIAIDGIEGEDNRLFGFIVGIESNRPILMMQMHYMENLALSLAPMLRQMHQEDKISKEKQATPKEQLLKLIKHHDTEREEYFMDYRVLYKKLSLGCMEELDLTPYSSIKTVQLHQWLIAIVYDEQLFDDSAFDGYITGSYDEVIEQLNQLN